MRALRRGASATVRAHAADADERWAAGPVYPPVAPWGRSRVVTDLDLRRSLAVVELTQVGTDAADVLLDRLVHFRDGMVDLIHFVLPLSGPSVEEVTDILVESGCRYAALLPFYRGYDVLMLQYTNMLEIDLSESDFHSPMARRFIKPLLVPLGHGPDQRLLKWWIDWHARWG